MSAAWRIELEISYLLLSMESEVVWSMKLKKFLPSLMPLFSIWFSSYIKLFLAFAISVSRIEHSILFLISLLAVLVKCGPRKSFSAFSIRSTVVAAW